MTDGEIRTALDEIARRELRWEGPLPEGDLAEHLDSVARLTLVVAIEDRFRIALDPDEERLVRTLDDVVRFIRGRTDART